MGLKVNEPKVIVNEIRVPQTSIGILRKLLFLRHFKNYSAQDVSYLFGKKANYFDEVEELKSFRKRIEEVFRLAGRLGNIHLADLFDIDIDVEGDYKRLVITKSITKEYIDYKMEIVHSGISSTLFAINEEIPSSDYYFDIVMQDVERFRVVFEELVNKGYFLEKIETYELYQKCLKDYELYIRPVVLRDAMIELTKRKDSKVKLKYDNVDHCLGFRYYYVQEG